MFVRAYLRASTADQDPTRASKTLDDFAAQHGQKVASRYIENVSGASTDRAELRRLLNDAHQGDIILIESVDRLSRLPQKEWSSLYRDIENKGLRIVSVDLPTSHAAMGASNQDDLTGRILDAVNRMMLDVMAAMARKDYEQRRERQQQGIEKAKGEGKFKGRAKDTVKRQKVRDLLGAGFSVRKTAALADASPSTVQSVKAEMKAEEEAANARHETA
ncbi:recombinase family protein [Halomonas sp. AOP43-A1-21]